MRNNRKHGYRQHRSCYREASSITKTRVHFALDDFGTGYSSLSQLKNFPINSLKIDQSFVKNSNGNDEDAAIVKLIIAMAKTLNFSVTCEGIETEEQTRIHQKKAAATFKASYSPDNRRRKK
ncbi:EAL domain-containing protein [Anaerobacillus sp. HL2]|nr:EAL domain-containing protein [Anaerobacillus sp. HL2]